MTENVRAAEMASAPNMHVVPTQPRRATQRRAVAGRTSWAVADQAVSSLTNFGLAIAVARSTDSHGFGVFGIALATYSLALGGSRAVASEPLSVRYTAAASDRWRAGAARSTGTALINGVAVGAGLAGAGAIIGGALGTSLIALAVTLPGLLLQDSWRFAFVCAGRPREALVNDLIWAAGLAAALAVVISAGHHGVRTLIVAWGAAAGVAAAVGVWQARLWPRPLATRAWWREHRDLAPRFLGEFASTSGTQSLVLFGIAAAGGLTAVAAVRAAWVLLGPLNVLLFAVPLAAVPEAVRVLHSAPQRLRRTSGLLAAGLASIALAWGALVFLLPQPVGVSLLGSVWHVAHPVIIPLTVAVAAVAVTLGAMTALRALAAARHSLKARLLGSVLVIVGGIAGTRLAATSGAAWGVACGELLAALIWWGQLSRALVRDAASSDATPRDRIDTGHLP